MLNEFGIIVGLKIFRHFLYFICFGSLNTQKYVNFASTHTADFIISFACSLKCPQI